MALQTTRQVREFRFEKNGTKVKLSDPNPTFTVEEVLRFYAPQYPYLVTALVDTPKPEGDTLVYNITTSVGTNA